MKRSNRLVILVGVLLAVLAFVGVLFVLNQQGPSTTPPVTQASVLVAKVDIAIGDEVTPSMVETKLVDPGAVVGTPMRDPSEATGRPAIVPIPAGAQVNKESIGLIVGAEVCITCQLSPGEKAIAFQVDRVTGLDFLILPGDHIDIVISQSVSVLQATADTVANPAGEQRFEVVAGLEGARTVKTVLQDKRVLYVSQARSVPGAEPTPPPEGGEAQAPPEITSVIIVFAGTDQDAELIKFAQNDVGQTGALTAVLRAVDDDVAESTTGLTLRLLIDSYGVPVPNIVLLQAE